MVSDYLAKWLTDQQYLLGDIRQDIGELPTTAEAEGLNTMPRWCIRLCRAYYEHNWPMFEGGKLGGEGNMCHCIPTGWGCTSLGSIPFLDL